MNQTLATLGLSGLLMLTTQARPQDGGTLVDLAVGAGEFTTLVAAVEAAGLVEALSGEGPLTVFAPTDEAFAALGEDTLKELLTERGRPQLKRILLHHVVAGEVLAEDVVQANGLATLAETRLTAQAALGRVIVDGAAVETADLRASNGVIHVIDRVLLPPARTAALEALLVGAVERGVALFNGGDEAGCCAVYATALDALRLGRGFGLSDWEREVLVGMLASANRSTGARELAWAYRGIIDAVLAGELPRPAPEVDGAGRVVFSFGGVAETRRWDTVLDGVMGGLSTGRIGQAEGAMIFEGVTSLENNGGFSSIRCGVADGAFAGADTIQLRVKGDGRTYIFGARTSSGMGGDSFWTRFATVDGEWQTVDVRIEDMERHFFGRRMRGTITAEQIRGLEFYVYDKKAGPFRLEVDEIRAMASPRDAGRSGS